MISLIALLSYLNIDFHLMVTDISREGRGGLKYLYISNSIQKKVATIFKQVLTKI